MGHDDHVLARGRDLADRSDAALGDRLHGLGAREPAIRMGRVRDLDLDALERPEASLGEVLDRRGDGDAEPVGDDAPRLGGTAERRRHDPDRGEPGERPADAGGLRAALVVERDVRAPLDAGEGVPFRASVTDECERRHPDTVAEARHAGRGRAGRPAPAGPRRPGLQGARPRSPGARSAAPVPRASSATRRSASHARTPASSVSSSARR